MLNAIYRFFAMRYIPADHEVALANALFDLKYRK